MPARIPLIVGFGGVNATGRLSFDHGYRRMILDELSSSLKARTYRSLATLMGIEGDIDSAAVQARIREGTLIRRLEPKQARQMRWHLPLTPAGNEAQRFRLSRRQLPDPLPPGWTLVADDVDPVEIEIASDSGLFATVERQLRVTSAGQVPTGFNPAAHYASRNHPRGLQLAVFGASDALRSSGIALDTLKERVPPDQFAVFSSSAMGQLDNEGYGGMYQNSLTGRRPTAKNVPLGLADMPADFINAYVLGTAGETGGIVGACASFLYNLKSGVDAIQSGRARVALVGNAESPIVPEAMEGYRTMGALAEDEALALLDQAEHPDHRRACRPFSDNCGFTIAESATYVLLMDAELALELGARNLGMVGGVFVNADGYKKSIPGPGIGNYLTVGKAMGLTRSLLGEAGLRQGSHVQAHGTGTPQNRITESAILSELAQAFGIQDWPVGAVKAFVGHSFAPAGGDQLAAVLGCWTDSIVPGIPTIDHLADDVHSAGLRFALKPQPLAPEQRRAALINSKGFGGNNATGVLIAPEDTELLLKQQFGRQRLSEWKQRSETVADAAATYDEQMLETTADAIYRFGEGVIEPAALGISDDAIQLPGYARPVSLKVPNPYQD